MRNLLSFFFKYNIYCLDGLIQNRFSSHFEFGSTIQLNTKRNESTETERVILCSCGINQSCT